MSSFYIPVNQYNCSYTFYDISARTKLFNPEPETDYQIQTSETLKDVVWTDQGPPLQVNPVTGVWRKVFGEFRGIEEMMAIVRIVALGKIFGSPGNTTPPFPQGIGDVDGDGQTDYEQEIEPEVTGVTGTGEVSPAGRLKKIFDIRIPTGVIVNPTGTGNVIQVKIRTIGEVIFEKTVEYIVTGAITSPLSLQIEGFGDSKVEVILRYKSAPGEAEGYVLLNWDDDDADGLADNDENDTAVASGYVDNELAKLRNPFHGYKGGTVTMTINRTGNGDVRIWRNQNKSGAQYSNGFSWSVNEDPEHVFVEGVQNSDAANDVQIGWYYFPSSSSFPAGVDRDVIDKLSVVYVDIVKAPEVLQKGLEVSGNLRIFPDGVGVRTEIKAVTHSGSGSFRLLNDAGNEVTSLTRTISEFLPVTTQKFKGKTVSAELNDVSLRATPLTGDTSDDQDKFYFTTNEGTVIVERQDMSVVDIKLAVDNDRDGTIRFDASDATSSTKPYRFWVNDDIDRGHVVDGGDWEEDDISSAESVVEGWQADWKDSLVNSTRDLEDFSRVVVSSEGAYSAFSNGDILLGLKWTNRTGSPAVKLYSHQNANGSLHYLLTQAGADEQLSEVAIRNRKHSGPSNSTYTIVDKSESFALPESLWSGPSGSPKKINLLFEACMEGKGQLEIVFLKKVNQDYIEVGQAPGSWLEFKSIGNMYEHWSVGNGQGTLPSSTAQRVASETGSFAPFEYDKNGLVSPEEGKYILYVHGWNMEKWEKERFLETAYKRMWWLGYKGRIGLFSWPTTNGFAPPFDALTDNSHYDRGEWSAWRSASPLRTLMQSLYAKYNGKLYVLAHSMGNVVTGEALRLSGTSRIVDVYVASQAALPAHCYDSNRAIPMQPELPLGLPVPSYSTKNVYPDWMADNGGGARVRVNFHNLNDYALWHDAWELGQIVKPDSPDFPSQPWFYGYNSSTDEFSRSLEDLRQVLQQGSKANPLDRYEIMSFASQSRSRAVGATEDALKMEGSLNLLNVWGNVDPDGDQRVFSRHKWHSGQFRSTNVKQRVYWEALLGAQGFDILTP